MDQATGLRLLKMIDRRIFLNKVHITNFNLKKVLMVHEQKRWYNFIRGLYNAIYPELFKSVDYAVDLLEKQNIELEKKKKRLMSKMNL